MTKLRGIHPKEIKQAKAKVLLFGEQGVGKTWAAIDFPAPYLIDCEQGSTEVRYRDKLIASGGTYVGQEQGSLIFNDVLEQIIGLATEKHPYKTLVIDSITELFLMEVAAEQARIKKSGKEDAFGKSKQPAVSYMRQLISWLRRIDMNVILIGHSKPEWGNNDKGERVEIGKTFDAWDKTGYLLDLVLEIYRQGPSHKARVRKSRLGGFPDSAIFDWSYESFAKRYGEDTIKEDVKPVVLADEESLTKLAGLVSRNNISQETQDKWLNKAGVERFEDMDADKVEAIIKTLEGKTAA